MSAAVCIAVGDASAPAEARRVASHLARSLGFSTAEVSNLAIVASEIATNIQKHAGEGCVVLQATDLGGQIGIEVLGLDRGPGIADLARSVRDGYSTAATAGTGLGAIKRIATWSDIYSVPGRGTAVLARLEKRNGQPRPAPAPPLVGAVQVPKRGENVCGDGWAMRREPQAATIMVADGLGHGLGAADASTAAIQAFQRGAPAPPAAMIERLHQALRGTRGAAVGVAHIDFARSLVTFAGIGNVVALLAGLSATRRFASFHGIVGGDCPPRLREFTYPYTPDSLLVMHTDGISSRWDLEPYVGLAARHPGLVAGVLFRDYGRDRDDATIVVAKGGDL